VADLIGAVSSALGGVPIPDLPVVAYAPEYMEQKATIDAVFAMAFGLYACVNPVPFVTGAPNLVKLLTEDLPEITGGVLQLEGDASEAAGGMLDHIEANRKKPGLQVRRKCTTGACPRWCILGRVAVRNARYGPSPR
jgi:anaerobic carbon-monoxide dehydrogenase catalytic subunit